jgi:hypothetical protein
VKPVLYPFTGSITGVVTIRPNAKDGIEKSSLYSCKYSGLFLDEDTTALCAQIQTGKNLKVLRSNTFKFFPVVRLIENCCNVE